jgi:hypothetical protein
MRRLVYGLLTVLVGVGSVGAKTYTNKTFLATRSHNDNMAMEYTGWHKQWRKMMGKRWGGTFQATGFYQASENQTDLGKYFGKYNSATASATNIYSGQIQDFIWVMSRPGLTATNNEKAFLLDPGFIIHDNVPAIAKDQRLHVKGTFRPKQTSYGIRLDYHQKLDKLAKGMYFKATVPIVHVKNDMNVAYTGTKMSQKIPPGATIDKTLANYLAGNLEIENVQEKLKSAKICGSQSETGVADVELMLGYNFLYKEHKHCGVNVSITIPTTDTPDGEFLFEATIGQRGHWTLGLGVDSAFELWQHGEKSIEFNGAIKGKYIIPETEKRTLGFKYNTTAFPSIIAGKFVPMGWYMLGGKLGQKVLFPLANILTRDVGVRPGWQVEGLANMVFNWSDFTFDLGYNLFAKERESVMVKCWPSTGMYAIAHPDDADPATAFTNANDIWPNDDNWIMPEDLTTDPAVTPVYVTHKIYGGVTYAMNDWEYPFMFGVGASWEFTQGTNSALDGYALWAKIAVTF